MELKDILTMSEPGDGIGFDGRSWVRWSLQEIRPRKVKQTDILVLSGARFGYRINPMGLTWEGRQALNFLFRVGCSCVV